MTYNHRTLLTISGVIWLGIGSFLLTLGLNLIVSNALHEPGPMIGSFYQLVGGAENAAILIIAASLVLGYYKGRFAMAKAVKRTLTHLQRFPNPTSIVNLYPPAYYPLLLLMMGFGMLIKWTGMPGDIRGTIDTIVGAALIHGAMFYFREAFAKEAKTE